MRWNEAQLAAHLERTGVLGHANKADTSRPPFAMPDEAPVFLDLPVPPSVNKTRRYDMASTKIVRDWKDRAEPLVLAAKTSAINPLRLSKIKRFEVAIVVSEDHTSMDLDNGIKTLIDYLKIIGVIRDDAQRNMRGLTVTWGTSADAPEGCRVFVRPCA
jgi:Holliday junction resolvase RusA-like endonuclease